MAIDGVVFDLDGVLVDSEQLWDAARERLARERGGRWSEAATRDMMGMSSPQWSRYMHEQLGVDLAPDDINAAVVAEVDRLYRRRLPLMPGAVQAVERMSAHWPLGLATSSNREIIDLFVELSGLDGRFVVTLSTEEVGGVGKPAPDVYLAVTARMGVEPTRTAAIEDSSNGLRAARAAGMRVVAVPNPHFPPAPDALELADVQIDSLEALTPELVAG